MSKIYQYDDIKKANQALGGFKKNGITVENISFIPVGDKISFIVVTDPKYTDSLKDSEVELKELSVGPKKTEGLKIVEPVKNSGDNIKKSK
jgi:hypothetical protein